MVASERPFYAAHAGPYDALVTDAVEPLVEGVHSVLVATGLSHARLLDAGCGTGRHADALVRRDHVVDLLVGHDDDVEGFVAPGVVVVYAHTPPLGWWTFDEESHRDGHAAAFEVVNLLVHQGGEISRGWRTTCLLHVLG